MILIISEKHPKWYFFVVRAWEKKTRLFEVPWKTISLCFVTNKAKIGTYVSIFWLGWMLCVIENMYLTRNCLWGNDIILLWHVSCPIYLAFMKDLSLYIYSIVVNISQLLIFCLFILICIKILFLKLVFQRQPHLSYHQIIWFIWIPCSIRSYDQFVNRVVTILRNILCWQPLNRERRPIKNMCEDTVIEKGNMLFSDFEFFVSLLVCEWFVKLFL